MKNPDEVGATRTITDRDMAQIKKESRKRNAMEESLRLRKGVRPVHEEEEEEEEDEDEDDIDDIDDIEEEEEDYNPGVERLTTVLAIVAAVLIGCVAIFLVGRAFGLFQFGTTTEEEGTTEAETMVTNPALGV